MPKLALGHCREVSDPGCLRAVLGELVLTFLFVFVGVGSAITGGKAVAAGGDTSAALIAVALGHALVVAVFATAGFHISGAHMNPAVTLSLAVGGHITLLKSAFFVVAQMTGSSLACILLRALTGGEVTPVHALTAGVGPIQGVVSEVVFTFTLLFTIYAAILDPKSSAPGFGPLLTGLLVGANTIAGGALTGASMNPARSFGPALATGNWENHWVYWVGPLAGGPLAVAVYEFVFTVPATYQQLPVVE